MSDDERSGAGPALPSALESALAAPQFALCSGPDEVRSRYPDRPRSYLPDGRGLAWVLDPQPGWLLAVDAEPATTRLPDAVTRRSRLPDGTPDADAVAAWTVAEVIAKLTDMPILVRLTEFGLSAPELSAGERHLPGMIVRTHQHRGLVVSVGAWGQRPARSNARSAPRE
ncbi:hypothetical protein ACMYYO_11430 [Dermacoccaceae bacterium W4C1]